VQLADLLLNCVEQARPGLVSSRQVIVSGNAHRTSKQIRRVACRISKLVDSLSEDVK
jgi:hypothetical protein